MTLRRSRFSGFRRLKALQRMRQKQRN